MKQTGKEKINLHVRNLHRKRYDFPQLIDVNKNLAQYVALNEFGDASIDFSNPKAVKELNKALLISFYKVKYWEIPDTYLCPPIPGRADYIHYVADLLASSNKNKIPTGSDIIGLDIGVGANCIYPLLGNAIYGWQFVGSDIDKKALEHAENILKNNEVYNSSIFLSLQKQPDSIFNSIILPTEKFDFTICNPPFHESAEDAFQASLRKTRNLTGKIIQRPTLNFGGNQNEIWCEGGEKAFILKMASESVNFASNCLWFTSLVSKETTISSVYRRLEQLKAKDIRVIDMSQGNKKSRIIAWSFYNKEGQLNWFNHPS